MIPTRHQSTEAGQLHEHPDGVGDDLAQQGLWRLQIPRQTMLRVQEADQVIAQPFGLIILRGVAARPAFGRWPCGAGGFSGRVSSPWCRKKASGSRRTVLAPIMPPHPPKRYSNRSR
jgi:hypothetical protein